MQNRGILPSVVVRGRGTSAPKPRTLTAAAAAAGSAAVAEAMKDERVIDIDKIIALADMFRGLSGEEFNKRVREAMNRGVPENDLIAMMTAYTHATLPPDSLPEGKGIFFTVPKKIMSFDPGLRNTGVCCVMAAPIVNDGGRDLSVFLYLVPEECFTAPICTVESRYNLRTGKEYPVPVKPLNLYRETTKQFHGWFPERHGMCDKFSTATFLIEAAYVDTNNPQKAPVGIEILKAEMGIEHAIIAHGGMDINSFMSSHVKSEMKLNTGDHGTNKTAVLKWFRERFSEEVVKKHPEIFRSDHIADAALLIEYYYRHIPYTVSRIVWNYGVPESLYLAADAFYLRFAVDND